MKSKVLAEVMADHKNGVFYSTCFFQNYSLNVAYIYQISNFYNYISHSPTTKIETLLTFYKYSKSVVIFVR